MDYSLKEVAGRIKDLREAKGYTPEELAKLNVIRCFASTCAEMLEDIKENVESEMPYYGGDEPSE